jgi:hypothetical protein
MTVPSNLKPVVAEPLNGPVRYLNARQAGEFVCGTCRSELLAARPGAVPVAAAAGDGATDRDIELLGQGVRMRTLYPHAVRASPLAVAYARALTEAGAEVRTVGRLPGHMIIQDRRIALLLQGGRSGGGLLIQEPCVVDFLCRVFDLLWSEGWSLPACAGRAADLVRGPKPAIVRMLGHGAKDETVARQLGMSVRTTRRHIAEIMAVLGALSRFQAGVLVARHGLLPPGSPLADGLAGPAAYDHIGPGGGEGQHGEQ